MCADGRQVGTETCDDGNLVNGDGCSDLCLAESGYYCSEAIAFLESHSYETGLDTYTTITSNCSSMPRLILLCL